MQRTPKNHQNHRIKVNQNHCGWHLAAVFGCGPVVHAPDLDIIRRKLFFSQCSSQCKNDLTKKWLRKDTKNPFLYARNSSGIGRKQVGFNFGRATSCAPSGRLPVWPDWKLNIMYLVLHFMYEGQSRSFAHLRLEAKYRGWGQFQNYSGNLWGLL